MPLTVLLWPAVTPAPHLVGSRDDASGSLALDVVLSDTIEECLLEFLSGLLSSVSVCRSEHRELGRDVPIVATEEERGGDEDAKS